MYEKFENERCLVTAEMIMAAECLKSEEIRRHENGIDYILSNNDSNEKVLMRVLTKNISKHGKYGVQTVDLMIDALKNEDVDKGVLVGKCFSNSAKDKMQQKNIQIVSEEINPRYNLESLYSAIQEITNELCMEKCSLIPVKEADCKGFCNDEYSCNVRLINDNASFHIEKNWRGLLENDLRQLVSLRNAIKKENELEIEA